MLNWSIFGPHPKKKTTVPSCAHLAGGVPTKLSPPTPPKERESPRRHTHPRGPKGCGVRVQGGVGGDFWNKGGENAKGTEHLKLYLHGIRMLHCSRNNAGNASVRNGGNAGNSNSLTDPNSDRKPVSLSKIDPESLTGPST